MILLSPIGRLADWLIESYLRLETIFPTASYVLNEWISPPIGTKDKFIR